MNGAPSGVSQTPINVLGAELVRRGHEVHAITLDPTVQKPTVTQERNLTLHFLPLRARARHRALDLFAKEVRSIEETIRSIRPDVVHAHWTYEHAEAAIRAKYPHLITMHDSPWYIFWSFRNAYRFLRLVMALRTLPRVRLLSVVSPYLVPHARGTGYFGNIAIVPNGIATKITASKSKHISRNSGPLIVTVGDTSHRKNVNASIRAFQIVREQHPQAQLHLFGPGLTDECAKGEAGVYGHGAVEHGELMRFLEEQADLLIHPSLEESFGVVLIEAMLRGVPSIGGRDAGGVPFVLGDELQSLLVNVKDPEEIASTALSVLKNAPHYEALSKKAIDRASKNFGIEAVTDRYLELYHAAIMGQGPR